MMKAYEVLLGYRIIVVTDKTSDEVKKAGRSLAKQMQVFPARDITVKETLPEKADGRWVIENGSIARVPLEVGTLEDLANVQTFDGDIASAAETGSVYTFVKAIPQGVDKRAVVIGKHGGAWIDVGALSAMMNGGK